jgi:hypothetical protein
MIKVCMNIYLMSVLSERRCSVDESGSEMMGR